MKPLRPVIDAHQQKYLNSCSPSLIEIMLKRHELVPEDYYELQDKYQDKNVGLEHFANETIEGLLIEKHSPNGGQSFVDRIRQEWAAGNMIGLYCVTPGTRSCHGWIVADVQGDKITLLSQYSEDGSGLGKKTADPIWDIEGSNAIKITDVIVGMVKNPKPKLEGEAVPASKDDSE